MTFPKAGEVKQYASPSDAAQAEYLARHASKEGHAVIFTEEFLCGGKFQSASVFHYKTCAECARRKL